MCSITANNKNKAVSALRIADLNESDKPREKALKHGIRSLSETELLAILLGGGLPGKSVIELAGEIMKSAGGSLVRLSSRSIRELCMVKGVGPAKAITVAAAFELGSRRASEPDSLDSPVRTSSDAYNAIRSCLENLPTEEFWIVLLSQSLRVIGRERIGAGGVSSTPVDVKVVIKRAIENLSPCIILAHNHPSGNTTPSGQDDALTDKIRQAAALLDIRILDHIIVGPSGFYSYADNGRL